MSKTEGINGVRQDNLSFGLNQLKVGIQNYTETAQEHLEWFWGYIHNSLGASQRKIEKATGLSYEEVRLAMTGRATEPEISPLIQAIIRIRKDELRGAGIVRTVVTEKIVEALNYARDFHSLVFIVGPTGRSKTTTAEAWAKANNHGRAKFLRVPSSCTRKTLAQYLCKACGIGIHHRPAPELEMKLHDALDHRNVIIADEAGFLIPKDGRGGIPIELMRDFYDIDKCSVVFIFTDVYLEMITHGQLKKFFEQFCGRNKFTVKIPDKVLMDEIIAAVSSFRPSPPQKLVDYAYNIANSDEGKLRTLFEDLERASDWARQKGQELDAKALRVAVDWRNSGGIWPEK